MNSIRVPAFLLGLGLALGAIAGGARAQQYDPYNDSRDSGRGDQDRYDEDRYDDYDRDHFDDRNGRRVIRCESQDRRTQYCDIDTRGGVRLVRRLSDARCVRGDTWGVNNRGIWVTNVMSHWLGKDAEIEAARNILDALSGDTPRGALNDILQTAA